MATSTCMKCNGTTFEMVEREPRHSAYKLMFIQCASCGGVVGVTEFLNIAAELQEMRRRLNIS